MTDNDQQFNQLRISGIDNPSIKEAIFLRSFSLLNFNKRNVYTIVLYGTRTPREIILYPRQLNITKLMKVCYNDSLIRRHFMNFPIFKKSSTPTGNDELVEPLQDLANIIADEATLVFTESYYPGVPDVDFVSEEHVENVINAMQRELDREGLSRSKLPAELFSLPKDRQRALVERRRYWFKQFGITGKEWGKNKFSLWKASNNPLPQ